MTTIPKYTENFDPGFQELSLDSFDAESESEKRLKKETLELISQESKRLKLSPAQKDFLPFQFGIGQLETNTSLNLKFYLDYLKSLSYL